MMEAPDTRSERDQIVRRMAEARVRRMVDANLMIDWTRDLLLKHGPRVVTETKGEDA